MSKLARTITALALTSVITACVSAIDEKYFTCEYDEDCPKGQECLEVDYVEMCVPEGWCNDDDHCRKDEYCDIDAHECEEYDLCDDYIPGSDDDDCCLEEDICDWNHNGVCDCDGECGWDSYDCS